MSRIGNLPITVPSGVEIKVAEDNTVTVKGPLGELKQKLAKEIKITQEDGKITVERPNDNKRIRSLHGLTRSLLNNMVEGVTKGFEKKLIIEGTGYRASKNGKKLDLQLGHSHPLVLEDPEGITTEVPKEQEIIIKGIDKQLVGNYTAIIRDWRRPEPYKGKGVRYADERIIRKEGKTGKKK